VRTIGGNRATLFNSAYTHYSPAITGYLETRGIEDPEAVTQDVFLDLYEQLADYVGDLDGIRPLAFTIAYARVSDHQRRTRRDPAPLEYDPDADERLSAPAEDVVVAQDGAAQLLECLVFEQREVITLRVVGDLSIEQTAQIMNKTPGAVKQLQRRALAALRACAAKKELYAC
jgi:RNA polymerase sigma-70 factor (ECF subfamily)